MRAVPLTAMGLCLWLASMAGPAQAGPTEDGRQGTGRAAVAAGTAFETCRIVEAGETLAWSYEASAALGFRVYFRRGEAVHDVVKTGEAPKSAARFASAARENYCLRWHNGGKRPASLHYTVSVSK